MFTRRFKRNFRETFLIIAERLRGLDFSSFIEPESLGLDAASSFPYMRSSKKFLIDVFDQLTVSKEDCLLDVGAGKGYAVAILQRYPFAAVDGVEISLKLTEIARRNLARLNVRSSFFCADASQFEIPDRYTFFYLSNPFPEEVMKGFLIRLQESLSRRPRRATIVYLNPTQGRLIAPLSSETRSFEGMIQGMKTGISVYQIAPFP